MVYRMGAYRPIVCFRPDITKRIADRIIFTMNKKKIILTSLIVIVAVMFLFGAVLPIIYDMMPSDLILPPNDLTSDPIVNLNDLANDTTPVGPDYYYKIEQRMWNADADIDALEQYLEGFGAKRIIGQEFENIKGDYALTRVEDPEKRYMIDSIHKFAVSRNGVVAVFVNTGIHPFETECNVLLICDTEKNEKKGFVVDERSRFTYLPVDYALFYGEGLLVINEEYGSDENIGVLYDENGALLAIYKLPKMPDDANWWNYILRHTKQFGDNRYYITNIVGTVGRMYHHEHYRYLICESKYGETKALLDFKKGFYRSALMSLFWMVLSIGGPALIFGHQFEVVKRLKKWLSE